MVKIQSKEIVLVPIGEIKLNPKNRNRHSPEQIARLVKIFEYQGFRQPLTISNQSGLCVAGEGRYLAAKKLKAKELPCIFQDFDSPDQETAHGIADNAIQGQWMDLDFGSISADLGDLGPDFDPEWLGMKDFTIDVADKEWLTDEDAVPEHVEPRTKLGDIYKLGNHRLMCGDSAAVTSIDSLTEGETINALISDPPYGIDWDTDYTRFTGGVSQGRRNTGRIANDAEEFDPLPWLIYDSVVLFGANYFAKNLPMGTWLVWDKRFKNGTAFLSDAELAWMKGGKGVYVHSVTSQGFVRPEKIEHPTQKPIDVMVWCMEKAKAGVNVLEPFAGSGTTLIACEKTNRKCFAMEIEPKHCDVIVARWEQFTGQKAELMRSGNDDGGEHG